MDEKTLTALKASIEKWERNAVATKISQTSIDSTGCPLCVLFVTSTNYCNGCPVQQRTGISGCVGTPWLDAFEARDMWRHGKADAEHFHAAAREEVAFLKSLLPASEQSS